MNTRHISSFILHPSSLLFILLLTVVGMQQTFAEKKDNKDVSEKYALYSSAYRAYPGPTQKELTPAPAGYTPVYFSHYGRHGSRYHIGSSYREAYQALKKADSLKCLTSFGKDIFHRVDVLYKRAYKRDGELTELGAQQHRDIAERMYKRFPEIFAQPIHIDAKSTVVIRCILSMGSCLQKLKSLNPQLDIRHDASEHDMHFMNHGRDSKLDSLKRAANKVWRDYKAEKTHPQRLMQALFTNDDFWQHHIDANRLMENIYKLAAIVQNCEARHFLSLWDALTDDEIRDWSDIYSTNWYVGYANSPLSKNMMPFSQRFLLRDIITKADTCLAKGVVTAHLRFGHDSMVMPLSCLMELDSCNMSINDLNTLRTHGWVDSKVVPMACNIQLIFYKNTNDPAAPVLVKVLRNENEAHLPIETKQWPYYNWNDLRDYYMKKLDSYKE